MGEAPGPAIIWIEERNSGWTPKYLGLHGNRLFSFLIAGTR